MKKTFFVFILSMLVLFLLSGCSPSGYCNILLFTDRMNEQSDKKLSLEDYSIRAGSFSLIREKDGAEVLVALEENESSTLVKAGVTLSKLDREGNEKALGSNDILFYRHTVQEIIYAFTLFDEEKSREVAEKILPLKSEDFLREGELTMEADNFHFVYYSNKLCCRFTVTDTYLEKTEVTEKPVSKPLA